MRYTLKVGAVPPTNYKDFPYLKPKRGDVVLCEVCRTELRHTKIVWLEWDSLGGVVLPGQLASPLDTHGCFPYCLEDGADVLRNQSPRPRHPPTTNPRKRGRPRSEVTPLQVQLWLSGPSATKVRALCKHRGLTPQELFRGLLERA